MRIVIVEDSLELLRGWVELLKLDDHEVQTYSRGLTALGDEAILRNADVFVTDYYLPDINGISLIEKVREVKPSLPGILLTGSRDANIKKQLATISNTLFLSKPLGVDALEEGINQLVSHPISASKHTFEGTSVH